MLRSLDPIALEKSDGKQLIRRLHQLSYQPAFTRVIGCAACLIFSTIAVLFLTLRYQSGTSAALSEITVAAKSWITEINYIEELAFKLKKPAASTFKNRSVSGSKEEQKQAYKLFITNLEAFKKQFSAKISGSFESDIKRSLESIQNDAVKLNEAAELVFIFYQKKDEGSAIAATLGVDSAFNKMTSECRELRLRLNAVIEQQVNEAAQVTWLSIVVRSLLITCAAISLVLLLGIVMNELWRHALQTSQLVNAKQRLEDEKEHLYQRVAQLRKQVDVINHEASDWISAFQNDPVPAFQLASDGQIVSVNKAWCAYTKLARNILTEETWKKLFNSEGVAQLVSGAMNAAQYNGPRMIDTTLLPVGEMNELHVRILLEPRSTSQGWILEARLIDYSEIYQLQQSLETVAESSRIDQYCDVIQCGIWRFNLGTQELTWKIPCGSFPLTSPGGWREILSESDAAKLRECIRDHLTSGELWSITLGLDEMSSLPVPMTIKGKVVLDDDGFPQEAIGSATFEQVIRDNRWENFQAQASFFDSKEEVAPVSVTSSEPAPSSVNPEWLPWVVIT